MILNILGKTTFEFNEEFGEPLNTDKLVKAFESGASNDQIRNLLEAGILPDGRISNSISESKHFELFPNLIYHGFDLTIEMQHVNLFC